MDKDKKIITKTTASSDKKFTAAVSLITSLVFFGMMIAVACVTVFSEKKEFSETQNSKLAVFPELTVKKYFNESFAKGIESFVSDHFAGHDKWIAAGTLGDLLAGKREVNNIYILKDRLVEKISEPDMSIVDKSIAGIKKYAEDNGVTPYVMLVPTQAEIYKTELPRYAPNPDQGEFINYVYGELGDSAAAVDVYSALSANSGEYIYYRTDHHWTSRGAFIAYTAAGKKMGYTPYDESHYDISHAGENFKGTFYSKVLYEGITPDTLDLWLPTESSSEPVVEITSMIGQEPAVHEGMYFREFLDVKDKYSTFFGTNQPMITVKTGNEGGKLLIFKDSYAHCFVPFLTEHYSEITMIDMRYIQMSYKQLVDVSQYDQTLFLYNVSTFMSDENIKKLMF